MTFPFPVSCSLIGCRLLPMSFKAHFTLQDYESQVQISHGIGDVLVLLLCRAHNVRFLIVLYDCCLSECRDMMIMSHCGISVVINVRLYDSPDACAQENLSGVLHYQPVHVCRNGFHV